MSLPLDIAKAAWGLLRPPAVDADAQALYHHRVAVAAFCMGNALALCGLGVIAFGIGVGSGFAYGSDVEAAQTDIKADRGEAAAREAFSARIQECEARMQNNTALITIYSRRVWEQLQIAHKQNVYVTPLPECNRVNQVP